MKCTLLKETFENALSLASRFTSHRVSAVQSIQGTKLSIKDSSITVTTTNLSDFFQTTITASVENEGECVFDSKKALEFLNFLQPGDITVELEESTILIKQGKTKGHFNTYQGRDFPELPHLDGKTFTLDKKLLERLPLVLFSASKDETRPIMTGVYVTHAQGTQMFVTTDGFRLSVLQQPLQEEFPQIILPAQIFQEVIRLAKSEKVAMTISPEDRLIKFTMGQIDLYSRVIEGEFPPYEKVIPQESTTICMISRQDFQKNIRLVSIFAREQADVIICDISADGMVIKPKGATTKDSQVFQPLDSFEGEPLKIAFNYKYVLEFLNTVSTDVIQISCTHPAAPGAFRMKGDDEYVHIIMPLRTEETTG